jgi:hypothetical protein
VRGSAGHPTTVSEAYFTTERLRTMKTRNSAAYKGVYSLLMKLGARDFRSGETINDAAYFDEAIDIHHIFPREYCARQGIDSGLADSILNKTPLSARTNRIIGSKAPSEYLDRLGRSAEVSSEEMNRILQSHYIEPTHLRNDDFDAFIAAREEAIAQAIANAMGKAVQQS